MMAFAARIAPRPTSILAGAALVTLLVTAGCSRRADGPPEPPEPKTRLDIEGVFEPLSEEDLELYQPHVRLGARYSNEYLYVAIRNRTNTPLQVEPANFGIIPKGGGKSIVPVPPGYRYAEFPRMVLEPGEVATGRFRFPDMGNLTGAHLFFRHPKVKSSRCLIRAED